MHACVRGEVKFDMLVRELRTGKKTLQRAMAAAGIVLQRGRRAKPRQVQLTHPPALQPGDSHYAEGPPIADFQLLTVNTLGVDPYLVMLRRVHTFPRDEHYDAVSTAGAQARHRQALQRAAQQVPATQRRLLRAPGVPSA
jgi:hypothetical protein